MMSWLYARTARNWRIAHKLWSVRIALFWAAMSGLWVALPAFQDYMPPIWFAAVCVAFSVAMCIAHLLHKPGLPGE